MVEQVDLLFVFGVSPVDHLISWAEGKQHLDAPVPLASHVALLFLVNGAWVGIEAVPPKVHVFDPGVPSPKTHRRYVLTTNSQEARAVYRAARESVGEPYSIRALIAAFFYIATNHVDGFLNDSEARVDCSMLATEKVRVIRPRLLEGTPASNVTPAGLESWATQNLKQS